MDRQREAANRAPGSWVQGGEEGEGRGEEANGRGREGR